MTSFLLIAIICLFPQISLSEESPSTFDYIFKSNDKYKDVVIEKVISADTFRLESGETISLIGLRAPEPPRRKKRVKRDEYGFVPKEEKGLELTIEEQAFNFAQELLEKKHIRLEFDQVKKDDDFHTLAYAFLIEDGTFVNLEILRHGFANLNILPPNTKYEDQLRDAYREARTQARGLQSE